MRKALRWLGIGIGLLLLLVAGIWGLSRALGPTDAQERALAILAQSDKPVGRNAFPAIWLLPYDVPEDQLEAVTAEDARRFSDAPLFDPKRIENDAGLVSVAEKRFRRVVPRDRGEPEYCGLNDTGCLDKVRGNVDAYSKWRNENSQLIQKLSSLSEYDYFRNSLPPRLDMPIPEMQDFGALPTLRALDFAEGRTDKALEGVCRDVSTLRRLSTGTDSLIHGMLSVAAIKGESRLFADMLEALPEGTILPAECATAFVPPRFAETTLCNAMRGEAGFSRNISRALRESDDPTGSWFGNLVHPILFDDDGTEAILAENYAWPCSEAAKSSISDDEPLKMPPPDNSLFRLQCAGNIAGCMLGQVGAGAFDPYLQRSQDNAARIKLMATLLWLHEHAEDKRSLAERLAARPVELKSPTRDVQIVDRGKALSIRMFDDSRGKDWQIPLPTCLQDAPVTR